MSDVNNKHLTVERATLLGVIEVDHLRKSYGTFTAVYDISFTAQPGEIFGLLGPNGAGKTTTISCISGLLDPTAGHIRILGHDVVREGTAARKVLGVVPQEIALYDDLSAKKICTIGAARRVCVERCSATACRKCCDLRA